MFEHRLNNWLAIDDAVYEAYHLSMTCSIWSRTLSCLTLCKAVVRPSPNGELKTGLPNCAVRPETSVQFDANSMLFWNLHRPLNVFGPWAAVVLHPSEKRASAFYPQTRGESNDGSVGGDPLALQ